MVLIRVLVAGGWILGGFVAVEEMRAQERVAIVIVPLGIGELAALGVAMPSGIASIEGRLLLGIALGFVLLTLLLPLLPALVDVSAHRFSRRG